MRRRRGEGRIFALINRNWNYLTEDEQTALELVYEKNKLRTRQLGKLWIKVKGML